MAALALVFGFAFANPEGSPNQKQPTLSDRNKPWIAQNGGTKQWLKRYWDQNAEFKRMKSGDLVFVGDSLTDFWASMGKPVWQKEFRGLKVANAEFIDRFGDMVEAVSKVRRDDLETMTKSVFQTRFPEAATTAEIYLEDDQWFLKGHLDEPLFSNVVRELPSLVLTGEVNIENLKNSSQARLDEVREEIGELTFIFLSGGDELSEDGLRQQQRMTGLLKEHEKLVADLKVPGAQFQVHALPIVGNAEGNRKMEALRIKTVEGVLKAAGIKEEQISPGVHDTEPQEGRVGVYTVVVEGDAPISSNE